MFDAWIWRGFIFKATTMSTFDITVYMAIIKHAVSIVNPLSSSRPMITGPIAEANTDSAIIRLLTDPMFSTP